MELVVDKKVTSETESKDTLNIVIKGDAKENKGNVKVALILSGDPSAVTSFCEKNDIPTRHGSKYDIAIKATQQTKLPKK